MRQPTRTPASVSAGLSLVGGASLAVVPASTLAIASRVLDPAEAGTLAVAITFGTFLSQVVTAWFVEAPLSSGGPGREVSVPRWIVAVGIGASVALAVWPATVGVVIVAIPLLQCVLEVGRTVGVAEHLDRREIGAALAVGGGCLAAVLLAFAGVAWSFSVLALGVAIATAIRGLRRGRTSPAPLAVRGWITADVTLTGVVNPLLNSAVLAALGPGASFLFAAISTVTGLLAIPLNFLRTRLLKSHTTHDIVLASAFLGAAAIALIVAESTGLFGFVFGTAWTVRATLAPLIVAMLWRSASLATTIPFAALRRAGSVRILLLLRAACAALTLGISALAVTTHSIAVVFGALLAGELLQALAYETARRRATRRSDADELT